MPFTGIADQHEIDIMTRALAVYCRERGIANEDDRTVAAERIAALFFAGRATADEILDTLRAADSGHDAGIGHAA